MTSGPSPLPRCPERAAFEDQPTPVWELTGADDVVAAANRAARDLFDDPDPIGRALADVAPGLGRSALASITSVRESGVAVHRTGWAVEVGARRVLLEVDLVPVRRPASGAAAGAAPGVDGVLVHSHELRGAVATARDATVALQRTLLPAMLPVLPDVASAARYVPGALDTAVGGDWFDVLVTDDERVAAHTGDVVGSGTAAAAAMAELRAVLRAALTEGLDAGSALARLHRYAARHPDTRAATVSVVLLHPSTGEFVHARCGRPPPVVRSRAGELRALDGPGAAPLGVGQQAGEPVPQVHDGVLDRGETLLLHSDGLLSPGSALAGGRPEHLGAEHLGAEHPGAEHLGAEHAGPDALCAAMLEATTADGPSGDVTVLALHRRVAPVPALALEVAADRAELGAVRARVSAWLDDLDLAAETRTAVPLIVTELVSNAVAHAYAGWEQPGRVRVVVDLDGAGGVRCAVEDDGTWRPAPVAPGRSAHTDGFGLTVVHELCSTVDIDTAHGGTRVTAVCPALHAAVVADAPPRLRSVPGSELTLLDRPAGPAVIAVTGAVDGAAADELRTTVLRRSAGGTRDVVIDLTAVTLLGSAAVRMLHEAAGFLAHPVLVAPPGSPARRVLETARLEHLLDGLG